MKAEYLNKYSRFGDILMNVLLKIVKIGTLPKKILHRIDKSIYDLQSFTNTTSGEMQFFNI